MKKRVIKDVGYPSMFYGGDVTSCAGFKIKFRLGCILSPHFFNSNLVCTVGTFYRIYRNVFTFFRINYLVGGFPNRVVFLGVTAGCSFEDFGCRHARIRVSGNVEKKNCTGGKRKIFTH